MDRERAKPKTRLGAWLFEAAYLALVMTAAYRVGHYRATMEAIEVVQSITAVWHPARVEYYGERSDTAAHARACCRISPEGMLLAEGDR